MKFAQHFKVAKSNPLSDFMFWITIALIIVIVCFAATYLLISMPLEFKVAMIIAVVGFGVLWSMGLSRFLIIHRSLCAKYNSENKEF